MNIKDMIFTCKKKREFGDLEFVVDEIDECFQDLIIKIE